MGIKVLDDDIYVGTYCTIKYGSHTGFDAIFHLLPPGTPRMSSFVTAHNVRAKILFSFVIIRENGDRDEHQCHAVRTATGHAGWFYRFELILPSPIELLAAAAEGE